MKANKEEYLSAKAEFEFLVQELITRIGEWDTNLPFQEPKTCIFRLNRDVRFSDNKKPYKENFGAFISYGGKKSGLPGYYIHISPKEIFVAGGVWMPESDQLSRIRKYISEHGSELHKIVNQKTFKTSFGALEDDQKLKRPPKGFDPENPFVEYLKFKSFVVSRNLSPKDAVGPGFGKLVDKSFRPMKDLNGFLLRASRS